MTITLSTFNALDKLKENADTEEIIDLDGSVLTIKDIVHIAEGIKVEFYTEPDAINPHEIAFCIGDACVEMGYSEKVVNMLSKIDEVSALDLLGSVAKLNLKMESDMLAARQDAPLPDWDCLTLERDPALEKSLDGIVYRTTASDEESNRYVVTRTPDINGQCDWNNPSKVLAI